ncbi:hypothetical protein J3459_012159 [Metarhizium acridum]|nr:hypothetical protein J3459_012159 [Metarhizium acridum]
MPTSARNERSGRLLEPTCLSLSDTRSSSCLADLPQWPPMAKRKRQQVVDSPLDEIPSNKTKPSSICSKLSSTQRREARADDPAQDQILPKEPKSSGTVHRTSNFPPEFYDDLPKIWLTSRALRELDRRNEQLPSPKPRARFVTSRAAKVAALARCGFPDLALAVFATAGGPDLSDLRGYAEPIKITMASTSPSATRKPVSAGNARTRSTNATTLSLKRRSSAYDTNFGQHCIEHNIYPPVYKFPDGSRTPKPANFGDIRQALKVPRGSLSSSIVPETAFKDFEDKTATESEGTVMRKVIPLIAGDADIPNEGHLPFINLNSITGDTTIFPVPDFFDGAHPGALDKKVRQDLDKIIIPNKKVGIPVAPNFFLEVKGPTGTPKVAVWQAVLDGAHGALIMHTLQNYLLDEPTFDGNAYAFSSTLIDGCLKLYAHHLTAPAKSEQMPGYHTTLVKACALSDDEVYSEGRRAFRNLRVRAQEDRDRFIQMANARARSLGTEDDPVSMIQEHNGSESGHQVGTSS